MAQPALNTSDGGGEARPAHNLPATLAIEIHFYRPNEPITIPLPEFDLAKAQTYFERLKSHVIEAQLHSDPRVTIEPVVRGHDVLVLDPMTIQQVILVDGTAPDEPGTDELPIPYNDLGDSAGGPREQGGAQLSADQQRRIAIILE